MHIDSSASVADSELPTGAPGLGKLLGSLYDGVMSPAGFQDFVSELAATFGLKAVTMVIHHSQTHELKGLWLHGISPEWSERYALDYAAEDMLAHHIMASPISRFYASNLDIQLAPDFLDSRFYRQWLQPQDIAWAAGAIVLREGDWCTQVIVQRTPAQAPFTREELQVFDQLMQHMRRAIQMRQRMMGLQHGQDFLAGGLDLLAMPTLLFDELGQVVHMNQRANELVATGSMFRVTDKQLLTNDRELNRKLHFEIGNAIAASRGVAGAFNEVLLMPRPARLPLMLMIAPMKIGKQQSRIHGAALLFAFDPENTPDLAVDRIRKLFSLTQAEATLSVALCCGKTLDEIAAERSVSQNTVRTQLKSVFMKTGSNRQAELVSLMLASPAYFLADPAG